ncbi:MAG: hypothetical protein Phog2KO_40640 [Phototrophicaceae bacterium]
MSRKILFIERFRLKIMESNPLLFAIASTIMSLVLSIIFALILYPDSIFISSVATLFIAFPVSYFISRYIMQMKDEIEAERLKVLIEQERVQILAKFIQNASHEFKTPLSLISTGTYLLSRLTDPEKRKIQADKINKAINNIDLLVDHMLYLAKLDASQTYPCENLSIKSLIFSIEDLCHKLNIQEKFLDTDEKIMTLNISCNQFDLLFALERILKNAVQASAEDAIINLKLYQSEEKMIIEIQDFGEGMCSDTLEKVFDLFYRHDQSHSTSGMGLGLPIAKRIILLHQGDIDVQSTLGAGTTVSISLPLAI